MKVYMSQWSQGNRAKSLDKNILKLALLLAKKNYGEVSLISDSFGCEYLKDMPFSSFINILDDVPDYPTIWSLGKIYAYKYACDHGPFLHIDNDVFLWKPLPRRVTDARVFVQSEDFKILKKHFPPYYDLPVLKASYKSNLPNDWEKIIISDQDLIFYNMGIFGGNDCNLIRGYCDYVLNLIEDKSFDSLWKFNTSFKNFSLMKSCMVEQGSLGIYLKSINQEPGMLFKEMDDPDNISRGCYTHLMLLKKDPKILEIIKNRLEKTPYDLEPRS